MIPRRVYIAGPMRGDPLHVSKFRRAARVLRQVFGHAVVSPEEINRHWAAAMTERGLALEGPDFMRRDIPELLNCDAICLLPGWETSVGARCEVAIAFTLGLAFLEVDWDGERMGVKRPERVTLSAQGYRAPPGPLDTLDSLAEEQVAFANATFGNGAERRASCWAHLAKEVAELRAAPNDVEEMADVFLLLAHGAQGLDLVGAVRAKLEKNRRRRWGVPDADGVVEHLEDPA